MFPALFLTTVVLGVSPTSTPAAVFPLKVSENHRFLVDQQNRPFLVVGDAGWSLIVQPGDSDIDRYLDDRKARGFNSIIINLIEHKFCTHPPKTRIRADPVPEAGRFLGSPGHLFDFAHSVVKKANDRGLVVWLFPAYLGYGGKDEGWFQETKASGKANLRLRAVRRPTVP